MEAIKSCYLLGSVEIGDLLNKCRGTDPNVKEQRNILIQSVEEQYKRARDIV